MTARQARQAREQGDECTVIVVQLGRGRWRRHCIKHHISAEVASFRGANKHRLSCEPKEAK